MLRLADDVKVYLHREPVDLRAGIDSLAILVEQTMQLDPWSRSIFAFCNRQRNRMKLLFYDRQGFILVLKRLEADRFRWPRRAEAVLTLTTEQLHWLLDASTSMPCPVIRYDAIVVLPASCRNPKVAFYCNVFGQPSMRKSLT